MKWQHIAFAFACGFIHCSYEKACGSHAEKRKRMTLNIILILDYFYKIEDYDNIKEGFSAVRRQWLTNFRRHAISFVQTLDLVSLNR